MKIEKYCILGNYTEYKYRFTLENKIELILHKYTVGYHYFWISDMHIDLLKDMVGLPEEDIQNISNREIDLKLLLKYNILTMEEYLGILLIIK